MYRDEPTGDITWHWAAGPAAEVPVWVGPRLGKECDEWCNTTNNPGYAVSPAPKCDNFNTNGDRVCTASASWCAFVIARRDAERYLLLPRINHYCGGTFDYFGTPEEQASDCAKCYIAQQKNTLTYSWTNKEIGEFQTGVAGGKEPCME
jgi:hypothetical protein